MPMVDGVEKAEDSRGIVMGNGGAEDRVAGDGTSNILQGLATNNFYYGGGGDDAFIISAKNARDAGAHDGQSTTYGDQFVVIFDFEGAGVSNGDFINLVGFDPASLTLERVGDSGTPGAKLYYYSVDDMMGHTYNFLVNSLTGNALVLGDYGFY